MEGNWKCLKCGKDQFGGIYCGNCGAPNPYEIDMNQSTPTYYNNLDAIKPPVVEPAPTPAETPLPSPSPTFDRHIRFVNTNKHGDWTKYRDMDTGYNIWYTEDQGYIAYDGEKEIYHIYPDGKVNLKDADGNNYLLHGTMTIDDFGSNMDVECEDGFIYKFKDGVISEKVTDYPPEKRFFIKSENGNTKEMVDRLNNLVIKQSEEQGSIAYDMDGNEVYHIYPDGSGTIKLPDDRTSPVSEKTFDVESYRKDMSIKDELDWEYQLVDGKVNERIRHDEDGNIIAHEFFEDDKKSRVEYSNGDIDYAYTGKHYHTVYKEVKADGTTIIGDVIIKPDNTFENMNTGSTGTCFYNKDGSFFCVDTEGNINHYSDKGDKLKRTTKDGTIYNYVDEYQGIMKNGKRFYSKFDHIEYDEDAYDAILNILNGIDGSNINTACSNIESELSSLPDKCTSDVCTVKSNISSHIDLIHSLGEMTNYSLLAYQMCDYNLKDDLNTLIDSLFGEKDKTMGDNFKNIISGSIEDKNGILGYNKNTDFKRLSIITTLLAKNHNVTVLEGDEYQDFIKSLNYKDSESLLILKEPTDFNGITMDVYRTIDVNHIDLENFEKYVEGSNEMVRNVDKEVLKYTNSFGTHFVYCGNYSAAPDLYNGHFAGISYPDSKATLAVYMGEWYIDDTDAILHELGHTFDHCIYNDQTGNYGSTTWNGYENYDKLPDNINTRELAHKEYSAYYPDYEYKDDYSNEDEYQPWEFFAETFRNFYTLKKEKHERFAHTTPETFSFFEKMEGWAGEQNAAKQK